MTLVLFVLVGLLGWGCVFWFIDVPNKQAYEVRDAYKFASYALLLMLICAVYKAVMYRTELRQAYHNCQ